MTVIRSMQNARRAASLRGYVLERSRDAIASTPIWLQTDESLLFLFGARGTDGYVPTELRGVQLDSLGPYGNPVEPIVKLLLGERRANPALAPMELLGEVADGIGELNPKLELVAVTHVRGGLSRDAGYVSANDNLETVDTQMSGSVNFTVVWPDGSYATAYGRSGTNEVTGEPGLIVNRAASTHPVAEIDLQRIQSMPDRETLVAYLEANDLPALPEDYDPAAVEVSLNRLHSVFAADAASLELL